MTSTRIRSVITGALLGALFAAAAPARALTVDQYLKVRRQAGFDPKLTYSQVESASAIYPGKVFELRGTVEGFIRRDQSVSFLLNTEEKRGIMLAAPDSDVSLVTSTNHQSLRVLVRVTEGNTGNVVPLEALAAAYDAEVAAREKEAAAREAALARSRARQREEDRPVARISSRGYSARPIASPHMSGGVSDLASRVLSPEAQAIYPAYRQFVYKCNPRLTAQELDTITVSVLYFAAKYRIDPRLVVAVIIAESDFDPRSTSHKGAMGLGQLMPDEARANRLTNPYDPVQNIGTSVGLLRDKLDRYRTRGDLRPGEYTLDQIQLALAAYNAGPGAVRKYGGIPPYRETQGYIKRITKIYFELLGYR